MRIAFAMFAVGWGAFYAVVNWLKTPAATDLRRRARIQILGGLIWSLAIAGVTYQLANGRVVLRDHLGDIGEG